jgi:hypothetical protein
MRAGVSKAMLYLWQREAQSAGIGGARAGGDSVEDWSASAINRWRACAHLEFITQNNLKMLYATRG